MSDDLALRVATYKVLADFAKAQYDDARAQIAARMERGDRLMAVTPDGVKLAAVSKKDPKPMALVVDAAALREWIAEHYAERMIDDLDVIGSDVEVKEALFQHAPHLLRQVSKADPDMVRSILTESRKHGMPAGPNGEVEIPGVQVDTPEGVVSCLPTGEAMAAVVDMLQRGDIDLFDVLPGGDV